MADEFSADALLDAARTSTGLDDFGSDHFREYLRGWCEDLRWPGLSPQGRDRLARIAVRNLATRLRIEDVLRRHPEITDVPLPPIVRIAGLPRSGTTLLHQLLSLGPRRRALLRWELVEPVPPPETATYASDPRIAKVAKPLDALRGTDLERMHWVEATDPEECTWGFYDLSGLLGRGCVTVMPRWEALLFDRAPRHRETYLEYRRLVQLLLWRNPLPPGGTLILKCPTDNDCQPEFLEAFPHALIVQLHRDPFRTVTSACRIQQVINAGQVVSEDTITGRAYVARTLAGQAGQADGLVAASSGYPGVVSNVRYCDLMADPAAVVRDLEQRLNLPGAEESSELVSEFLERQRRGARANPPADYGNFGATPEMVRGEPSMKRYIETFDIPAEWERVTAPLSRG